MKPKLSPLQILLLVQLEASPKYGYEMLKSIKDAFEGVWEPRTGTIYPALKSLEKRGLIETHVKDGVGFYHITPKGTKYLQGVGTHQARLMRFSNRFLETLAKWMSPSLKKSILLNVSTIAGEDLNIMASFTHIFDGVEPETKLIVLKALRTNFAKRISELDAAIAETEASQ